MIEAMNFKTKEAEDQIFPTGTYKARLLTKELCIAVSGTEYMKVLWEITEGDLKGYKIQGNYLLKNYIFFIIRACNFIEQVDKIIPLTIDHIKDWIKTKHGLFKETTIEVKYKGHFVRVDTIKFSERLKKIAEGYNG